MQLKFMFKTKILDLVKQMLVFTKWVELFEIRYVQPVGPLLLLFFHDLLLSMNILIPENYTGWWTRVRVHPSLRC